MSVDAHTLRTTLWHGTRYLVDGDGITDGRLTHHTPENVHLTAARLIAEMPDHDVNQLPVTDQIALGILHALIANAQTQPQHWTPRKAAA